VVWVVRNVRLSDKHSVLRADMWLNVGLQRRKQPRPVDLLP
jgi:hypothetical protein